MDGAIRLWANLGPRCPLRAQRWLGRVGSGIGSRLQVYLELDPDLDLDAELDEVKDTRLRAEA